MIRDTKKSKQLAASFLIILSLFVSSVAACICSHHVEISETESSSCHEQSEKKQDRDADSPENLQQFDSSSECCCLQPAPRAISKSETIKLEKQALVLPASKVEIKTVSHVSVIENAYFEKPFYLSDSFYNLKSPRAPPAV